MTNIQMAMNNVSQGDYMVSLKNSYFSVPHCKHLFICLPFEHSLVYRGFTKILKPVVSQLRLNGFRIVIFLDDISLVASSFPECIEQLPSLRKLLENLGFVTDQQLSQGHHHCIHCRLRKAVEHHQHLSGFHRQNCLGKRVSSLQNRSNYFQI